MSAPRKELLLFSEWLTAQAKQIESIAKSSHEMTAEEAWDVLEAVYLRKKFSGWSSGEVNGR